MKTMITVWVLVLASYATTSIAATNASLTALTNDLALARTGQTNWVEVVRCLKMRDNSATGHIGRIVNLSGIIRQTEANHYCVSTSDGVPAEVIAPREYKRSPSDTVCVVVWGEITGIDVRTKTVSVRAIRITDVASQ